MSQHIGIYGGTFDPVHHGHLILGRDAVEQLGLSRLIFVPAAISPHKLAQSPGAPGEKRLEMLRAAVAGEKQFAVDDCELRREGPSYTFDTIRALRGRLPSAASLFYLVGEDNLPDLHTWHRINELRSLVTFVVFHRRVSGLETPVLSATPAEGAGAFPVLSRRVDISATEIRNRVASGLTIRYLVPEAVAALIEVHRLYRLPNEGGNLPSLPKR